LSDEEIEKEGITMSKKIILLALAVASMAAFALPAPAVAVEEDVPVHLVPAPVGTKTVTGGTAVLTGSFGSIKATSSSGTITFTNSTTGTIQLTLKGFSAFGVSCQSAGQPSGVVALTTLEFHLLTVEDTSTHATGPGMLITPTKNEKGETHFATFECPPFGKFVIGGNGLIGTTTQKCGESKTEPELIFSPVSAGSKVQTHKTVVGTPTEYNLTTNGGEASLEMSLRVALGTAKLECT
jgi:hypothetical protein